MWYDIFFFFFNNGGKNRDEILLEIRCFQWKGRRKGRAVSRETFPGTTTFEISTTGEKLRQSLVAVS